MKSSIIFKSKILTLILSGFIILISVLILPFRSALIANAMNDDSYSNSILEEDFQDDNVIVVLDSSISAVNKVHNPKFFNCIEIDYINDLTANSQVNQNSEFRQILQIYLKIKSKANVLKAVSSLNRMDCVISAEPNYLFQPMLESEDTYDDEGDLWNLYGDNGIKIPEAWSITTGSKNVRVGVIDTGIAEHPDLKANLTTGWDAFNNNSITTDDTYPHGTLVAGIIGAVREDGLGVGINKNVTIVPLQACDNDNGFWDDDIIKAIKWASDKWGTNEQIDIINFSVAGFGESTGILESIRNYKGLFVWAAGNKRTNIDKLPDAELFNLPNLISVGAIKENGKLPLSTNFGKTTVDLFAPGDAIWTTSLNNGYTKKGGTSFAAPHVTGVAALIYAKCPDISASAVKKFILNSVDKDDRLENLCVTGGRLNAYKALSNAHTTDHTETFQYKSKEEHWVMCVVCNKTLRIEKHKFIFDSFPSKKRQCKECGFTIYDDFVSQLKFGDKYIQY